MIDRVRRDYILGLLEAWSGDIDDIEKLLEMAMRYADRHPYPSSPWISAKKQLPELDVPVLFYHRLASMEDPMKGYRPSTSLGYFYSIDEDDYIGEEYVDYWMPLPKIEKEKRK